MHSTYYYLIQPTSALIEAVNARGGTEVEHVLTETVLWTRVEGGLETAEKFTDSKIIYQCDIHDLHIHLPLYEEIFGDFPISEETFDIFWTIKRFGIEEDFDEMREHVSVAALERIRLPEGSEGKRYYDELLRQRREGIEE